MAGMTMTFKVKDPQLLDGHSSGRPHQRDAGRGGGRGAHEHGEEGRRGAARKGSAPAASSGFELLKPGEPVPDAQFVDQDGKARAFSSFKGSPLAITFIYTRCPIPDVLPVDGPPVRGDSADAQDGSRAAEGPPAQRQLRPGDRHARRAEGACGRAEGRPRAVDLPDRRSRQHRSVRVPLRRLDQPVADRSHRHHAQPADGDRRSPRAGWSRCTPATSGSRTRWSPISRPLRAERGRESDSRHRPQPKRLPPFFTRASAA